MHMLKNPATVASTAAILVFMYPVN